jgi:hypothetical protein
MRRVVGFAFAAAFVASVSPALAAESVEAGILECRGVSQQYIVASITNMQCLFRPNAGRRPEPYTAVIRRGGLDIGFNQSTVLAWAVFSPTTRPGPGSLSGVYVGGSANATLGIGVGANALFGGSNTTISLQPVSLQAQTGIGAVGGISALELQPYGPVRRHHASLK